MTQAPTKSVSVVIPVYNRPQQVLEALYSVARQTVPPSEVIVVDDASTDQTKEAVANWIHTFQPKYIKSKFVHELLPKNFGVSAARNRGVGLSTGKWIAFLDSDDVWKKKKLEMQLEFFARHPDCRWLHCDERWLRDGQHLNQKKNHKKEGTYLSPDSDLLARCLELCLVSPSAVVLERSLLAECDGFDESFEVCEDFDLWLRLLPDYPIGFVAQALVEKRGGHADQLSRRFHSMDWWRLRALQKSKAKLLDKVGSKFDLVFQAKLAILRKGFGKRGDTKSLDRLAQEFPGA